MSTTVNDVKDAAVSAAEDLASDAIKGSKSAMGDAMNLAGELITFLRKTGVDESLRRIGLSGGTSKLGGFGLFAGGVIVGAGLGLLLAPMSGRRTRDFLADRFREVYDTVKSTTANVASEAEGAGKRVADSARSTGKRVANEASDLGEAALDAVDESMIEPENGVVDEAHTKAKRRRHHDKDVS